VTAVRVGVVTTSYPRTDGDGDGGFVAAHAEALARRGLTVEVIAAGGGPAPRDVGSTVAVTRVAGDRLFYRGGAPDQVERHRAAALAAVAFTLHLTATVARRARGWDRVVAHWLAPSALAALPTRGPLLAIAHGGDVHTLRQRGLLAPMLGLLRRRRARLVFVSHELRDLARAVGDPGWLDDAAIVQPMGLPLARFAAVAASRRPDPLPLVLCLGRLVPIKGVDVALAALAELHTPIHLVIAGDGPDAARLATAARDAHHQVSFVGRVTADGRDALLRRAALVIVPSRRMDTGRGEGTPLVALEALASGVPVIASRTGGLAELTAVRHVAPDAPAELAAAIDQLLAQPPAPATLTAAVAHLDWDHVVDRLERHAAGTGV
jgi:glycosyltransferase involved in cell wall biosynthesis